MTNPFFTIGHSTRPLDAFADLLKEAGVRRIVDVRTVPRSRTNPQYNGDAPPGALGEYQIGYEPIAALGGLRPLQRGVPASINALWENRSFHNHADYAMGEEFRAGLRRLRALGEREACAVMCADAKRLFDEIEKFSAGSLGLRVRIIACIRFGRLTGKALFHPRH